MEKGWLGGGNVARNTTVIRSNYLWDASAAIYEHSMRLWEGLEDDLDWDLQFDQKGVLNVLHHLGEVRGANRRVEANHLQGVDAEMLDARQVKEFCPIINISPDVRYPVIGGALQRRGGTARHDRVAWSFATRASERGVDIVEHCEVTGFLRGPNGEVTGVETSRGPIRAPKVGLVAAGHTSVLTDMVGLRLPLQSHPLQALVSALYEPVMPCVIMSAAVHVYVSQADKGELVMGAGIDPYNGYGQRGSFHVIEHQMAAAVELFPIFRHAVVAADLGRHRRREPRRLPDHRPRRRSTVCS